jgi:ADP-heptose:LPS heptosyltransferase
MARHFVLIRLYRYGDLLMSSAVARAWKREAPTHITWVVSEECASFLRGQPYIDRMIVIPVNYVQEFKEFTIWAELDRREERFGLREAKAVYSRVFDALPRTADRVVNLTFNAAASMLAGEIEAPERLGPYSGKRGEKRIDDLWSQYYLAAGTDLRYPALHWVDAFINISKAPRDDIRMEWQTEPDAEFAKALLEHIGGAPYFVVQLGASEEEKKWSEENFIEASARIAEATGMTVVFAGSKNERIPCLRAVRSLRARGVRAVSLAGETDFRQLATTLSGSFGLLSNDTFAQHLSSVLDVPSVTVYQGNVSPWLTIGYREGNRAVVEDDQSPPSVERVVDAFLDRSDDFLVTTRIGTYQFPMPASLERQPLSWQHRWIVGLGHLRALDPSFSGGNDVRMGFPRQWLEILADAERRIEEGTIVDSLAVERQIITQLRHPFMALLMMLSVQNRFSVAYGNQKLQARNYRWLADALCRAGCPE